MVVRERGMPENNAYLCSPMSKSILTESPHYLSATLPCGVRVIFERQTTEVAYCGYVIGSGTSSELPEESGMAHFIEHMSFKGTERRDARHINDALEKVGADLNAYTGKEETVYYTAVSREELPRAIDVLTDMVFHSTFPQKEIDKEVEVIADEISSYKDTPSELIFDEFEEMLFEGSPLGRNILGDIDRLRSYTTEDALRFHSRLYSPSNATFYIYADIDFQRAVKLLERATSTLRPAPVPPVTAELSAYEPRVKTVDKGTHMAHVITGARAFGGDDPRRMPLLLLSNILGGPAMNSRLNLLLRERRGLVYTVESYTGIYRHTGMWGIYFGCEPSNVERCRRLIASALERVCTTPLSEAALAAAKRQIRGQFLIGLNDFSSYARGLGRSWAKYGRHRDVSAILRRIEAVTPQELCDVARDIMDPSRLTTLIYR